MSGVGSDAVVFEPSSTRIPPLGPYVRELWARRRFVRASARAEIKGGRSTMLIGELWALLDPLLQAGLYWLLFTILRVNEARGTGERLTLLIGCFFLYGFTRTAMNDGSRSLLTGRGLVLNSAFPRALLPITVVYRGLVELAPAGVVFLVIHLSLGQSFGAGVLWLPVLLAAHTALNLGVALLLATVTVFVRDVSKVIGYGSRVLLFITPVLYPISLLEKRTGLHAVLVCNPLYPLFAAYQEIIGGGTPTLLQLGGSLAWAAVFLLTGAFVFLSRERTFALHV